MTERPTKVLLVDDVRLFLELEKTFFRRQGCEIYTATAGPEALDLAHREKPDLVVLDLYLPEMDGLEVLKRIRSDEELKKINVIIVSVSGKEEDIQACKRAGCDAYLTKPITQKMLLDTAAQLLRIPQRIDIRIWVEIEIEGFRDGEKFYGQSDNISIGGIYVKSDKEFPLSTSVNLRFSLPGQESVFAIRSQVLRTEKLPVTIGKFRFGLGFHFLDVSPQESRQIQTFVQKTMEK